MSEISDKEVRRDPALEAIYRAASDDAPPPALDAAILAAAHREVGARPRPAGHTYIRSWRGALSVAAVLVLSVSLVMVMREEAPDVVSPMGAGESGPAEAKLKSSTADMSTEGASSRAAGGAQQPRSVGLKPSSAMAPSGLGMRAPESGEPVRPTAKDAHADRMEPPPGAAANLAKRRDGFAQSNEMRSDKPVAETKQAQAAGAVAGSAAETTTAAKVASLEVQREAESAERAQLKDRDSRTRAAADSVAATAAPAAAPARPAAPPAALKLERNADLPPEKWLERIEELRKQGKLDEARSNLLEFKKRYPDYRLPDPLRDGIK